jgi:hypothetical protein
MSNFEYKVIPAPISGKRGKGVKGADGRFANALSETINELAAEGWEYQRAESLPSSERTGIMRKRHESFQNVLVFRRATDAEPIATESTEPEDEPFNPFKKFSVRKEPALVSAAATAEVEEVEATDDIDETEEPELSKRPSKPAD